MVLWLLAALSHPDEPALSDDEKGSGFKLLFNGKDLNGWEEVQGKSGTFEVKDGVLCGLRKDKSAYWLSSVDEYGDFELRLQYKIPAKGNSGVFIRAPRDGRTSQKGMEIQIYDEPNKAVPDKSSTGSIYQVVAPHKFAHHPPGEWNDLWILCNGEYVKVTINGVVVTDADMSNYELLKERPRKGYIGVSAHTDTVQFRKIRIRRVE
jgi:hypothetical protein